MSSLWTPDGERPVRRPASPPPSPPPAGAAPGSASPTGGGAPPPAGAPSASEKRTAASDSATTGTPGSAGQATAAPATDASAQATADQVEQLRRELASTPAAAVIANHAYGLFELAAIHLSEQPPRLEDARLAVDAFGGLVESLGARLGDAAPALRDALAQIRLAFVQISNNAATANGESRSDPA